jgi:hypothetical protein
MIAALAALGLMLTAFDASAATGGPPYKLDAKGKCHDSSGKFAKQDLCKAPASATAPPKHCKDPKTHKFVKCTAPGAVPA